MQITNLVLFIILTFVICSFIPKADVFFLRRFSLGAFGVMFLYSLLLLFFNNYYAMFDFQMFPIIPGLSLYYFIGIDGISAFFIVLTQLLFVLCVISSFSSISFNYKLFVLILLILDFFLVNLFGVLDIFAFYILFESILVPMFLLIGIWGSRQRRVHAALQFFFYTLIGSFFMLLGLALLYAQFGTTNLLLLSICAITEEWQILLWVCFFIAFAVKIPMFPFHIWPPEAHVEAPTVGSVLLAGILLKLGGYGFIRFLIPLFPTATHYFTPFVMTLATVSVIYTSLTAIRQVDLKKIVAYASISHMNMVVLGIFNYANIGLVGSLFLMLGHGIVSSGLFFAVGVLYERYHTRTLKYYRGLVYVMPVFAVLMFILLLANFSFPGTCNFIGEFLILAGLISQNFVLTVVALISIIFSVVYSIWLYNRLFFGAFHENYTQFFADLSKREFFILFTCVSLSVIFGFFPNLVLHKIE